MCLVLCWQAAKVLDTNKNGMIEAEEFLKAFFEMGTHTHTYLIL